MIDRVILNYFVPFTNGKFVASCLMTSPDVIGKATTLNDYTNWVNNEYSDIDFWWIDSDHNWFNTTNWIDYIKPEVFEDQYKFYTCHEDYTALYVKRLLPSARIISIVPDLELCKSNYLKKNWIQQQPIFEDSRVYKEFQAFNCLDDLVINQVDLFKESSFIKTIEYLSNGLNITVDMEEILAYRNIYFAHPMNQIT